MNIVWLINKINLSTKSYPHAIFSQRNKIYTCINSYKYHIFHKDPSSYKSMDGIFVDGIFLCKAIKLLWGKKIKRLSFDMTSMAKDLFTHISKSKETIYFIGDEEQKISEAVRNFSKAYPNMNIIGYRNGFFKDNEERQQSIISILKLKPDFVIVGMGGKLQEQYLIDLKNEGFKGIGLTCGGFFHQVNDNLIYYPKWINKYNLRAAYRMIKEKTYKRLYHLLFTFPILFVSDTIFSQNKRTK